MTDKLCDQINYYIKDEAKAVLSYVKTLGDIDIRPDLANTMISIDDKDIHSVQMSIYHAVEKIVKEQAEHFFWWKAIGKVLNCPEPSMTKDEYGKFGEALERIGEMIEEKGERFEKKGEDLERLSEAEE